ncbi:MAG: NAD(P)/FAD-dependent oxidoreductase [Lawsonibacter sp.]
MTTNTKADVIVIGGGAIGCSTAYQLRKRGVDVLVLEANMIGHGGSSRNGGGVRQSARDVRELPLAIYSVEHMWPTLSEELGVDVEYHKEGNLRLAKTDEHIKILENLCAASIAAGLDVHMVSGDEARQICPYMSEMVIAASWCPTDGHANPMVTTLAFYKRARELGARFRTGVKVVALKKIKGRIREVIAEDGTVYQSDAVVLAAGLWSRPIAETVGIFLPILPRQDEALVTEIQPKMFPQMLGTAAADFYGHQTDHGSFVFGGHCGMEDAIMPQNNFNSFPLTAPATCRGILKYFPVLADAKIVRTWSGWLDMCVDHVPIVSPVEEVPGLVLGVGFTGHGFGICPGTGLTLAELAMGEKETTIDVSQLRYDRFKSSM